LIKAAEPLEARQNPVTLQIIMFLVLTGARRANVFQARWGEIDEERELWNIPGSKTKSGKPQSIHLSQEVMILIRQQQSRGKSEYLFSNPKTGRPFTTVFKSWNRIRKAAGLAHVRMHDLRHTFASLLINGGASLFMVQSALGHASPKMTQRYAHLSDATQKMVVQKAASLLEGFLPKMLPPGPPQVT
jgi:integrase